ncbi:hypothetical protein [Mycobacterium paraterrae]|uniref:DUF559 domain-containing protein n=1 Tax=Mycobacterium paraterrae TaxID=577492 RepID=A0ABY3VEA4_9MYCO|nr:hypothetical protein [Mycobacterium paraterrae]UMB67769.1 hypothetical protein MKK62_14825 [Mycobacterium paraterrae]
MRGVFIGSEAVRRGEVSRYQLRSQFRSIYPDVYLPKWSQPSLRQRSEAAWLWSGRRGVLAGLAAAAWHGSRWVDDDVPIELIWRNPHSPAGIVTRNDAIRDDEVARVGGLPVTSLPRTAYDLGRTSPRGAAVARLDALVRANSFPISDVQVVIERHPRARGLRQLRAVLPLVDGGAASPKETWLRLLLIDAGLPAPTTQLPVTEGWRLIALLDMGWETYKVAVEYDGEQHRTNRKQYAKDHWRLPKLDDMGWIVVRVIAEDAPADVIRRVRGALSRRGWRDT